jgi:TadE-like protein
MKKIKHFQQRGQSLVEFAILIPAFILMVVVIFDLGRAVYYSSVLQNAARAGVRYSAVHPNDQPGMEEAIFNQAVGLGLNPSNIIYAGLDHDLYETIGGIANPAFRVTLEYYFTPATPLVSSLLPSTWHGRIRLESDAVMRTEYLPTPIP